MPLVGAWFKVWLYLGLVCGWAEGARPLFDSSTDMGLVLIPADAEVESVIYRLRAIDQDADFPLVFEVTATITPVVRIENLPCTLYNKICQANVILTKRLTPGRFHDFAVRVRDTKGDSNTMQATISATNATTSRDKIFPHIPSLIMVPEDTKMGTELDYLLVRANARSGRTVYIELWQPKELFTIRQRHTPTQTRGGIILLGELDFETQSMYTLTIYAIDPYMEPGKDTRNIAGLSIVVIVQDVQDVPPIFTLAPPLTRLNNSVQVGDVILRVHAEDGDKGVPREVTYGLVPERNPFVTFFNISETTGEIVLAKPLEELTQITHVGAPVVLTVVAEEIRRSRDEPPAQATVVDVGFLLGEPGNSPPYFENDNYVTSIPENLEPGSVIMFPEQYSTRVHDEDIGKAGVFALKLQNNNGTFEINPTVAERTADFTLTVRDNTLIDYETYKSLSLKIVAQEVGPATNLSASASVLIFIEDVNDNSPVFDEESYEVTLSENVTAGTRVIQVHATDKDTGLFGSIRYTGITGQGNDAFAIDPDTGLITVAMGSSLDREMAAQLHLTIIAHDENGKGNMGTASLIVNLLDVNDNAPIFEKDFYEFTLNSDLTNFTSPAFIKATDADAEPPNNEIRYEIIHGNYENKFYLNEITGELTLRSPITKFRRKKQSVYDNLTKKVRDSSYRPARGEAPTASPINPTEGPRNETELKREIGEVKGRRRKRAESEILYTLTARAYDLGVPHLASETEISIVRGTTMEARIMMFVVPGEHPNLTKTAEALATITGGRVTVLNTRPYTPDAKSGVTGSSVPSKEKRTIVIARVEQTEVGVPLVDVEKIRNTLAVNGMGILGGTGAADVSMTYNGETITKLPIDGVIHDGGNNAGTTVNKTITNVHEEVTVYKAENKLLLWLLIVLGVLMLAAIAALIICCTCPGCPFYMAPRKRRIYSSETLIARPDGRPKRHLHRKPIPAINITSNGKKQAWSADPTQRNWQFNRRNTKNGGLASLPGDVVYISERRPIDQANVESLRLRDGPAYEPSSRRRVEEQERMYVEDVGERKIRDYDAMEADSLQRHEIERGSDILRQSFRQRYVDPESNNEPVTIREQHFYRDGNAEVLQLVTRGQVEDTSQQHHYPTTFIIDGKDVLLQRFIQDQKSSRHELQEPETARTVESHQRPKNLYQQEVLLLPEELEIRHRRAEEVDAGAQKLAMDDGYAVITQKMDAESQARDVHRQEVPINVSGMLPTDRQTSMLPKDQAQAATYTLHDLELARQNVLLTRLLLERETRHAGGGVMMDAASYLETQSLPGQVAIATQTDRVAATQTERQVRSRSDNDESDEDTRSRRKMKTKKRYGESELTRTRAPWVKSPIEEEGSPTNFDKRLSILRKKVKDVKEGRKVSLEPKVLREISDSLEENGSAFVREKEMKSARVFQSEESGIGYKVLGEEKNGSSLSTEVDRRQDERTSDEKRTESLSSPEVRADSRKYVHETMEKKSTKKESKVKKQKKVESVIKPSFRGLEREITMLTKKLSKFADRKMQQTGSESTSREKSRTSTDSKKDSDESAIKKPEDSKKHKRFETSPSASKDVKREQFKYQQPRMMSPGSSECEDVFEKPKKSKAGLRQEAARQKQSSSHTRVKKQIERKERKKQIAQQEPEKRKDAASKDTGKPKTERASKLLSRKLAAIGRRERVTEELSTGTSSDRVNGTKDLSAARDSDKRSSESSEVPSHRADKQQPRRKLDHVSERFSDDFVTEPEVKGAEQRSALRSVTGASARNGNGENGKREKDAEIRQQFTDDFVLEAQMTDMKHPTQAVAEKEEKHSATYKSDEKHSSPKQAVEAKLEPSVSRDFDEEHVTLREVAEDITVVQDLQSTQPTSEMLKAAIKAVETKLESSVSRDSDKEHVTLRGVAEDIAVLQDLKSTQPTSEMLKAAIKAVETKLEPSVSRDSDKEHVTLRGVAEDIAVLQDLKSTQPTSEILKAEMKQKTEPFEISAVEQFEKSSKKELSLKSESPERIEKIEKSPPHSNGSVTKESIAHALEKSEEEKPSRKIKKKVLEKQRAVSETDMHELTMSGDIEESARREADVLREHVESPKVTSEETQQKHIDEHGLHIDTVTSIKAEKDSADIKDTASALHSEEDKTAALHKAESEQEEQSSHKIKEHDKKEISPAESETDSGRHLVEKLAQEEVKDKLHKDKSDTEEKEKIAAASTSGYQDVTEKVERDVKLTTAVLEEPSDSSQFLKDEDTSGVHRAFTIDDQTLMYIDDSSQEESKDESEPGKATDIKKDDTTTLEYSADNIATKIELEDQEAAEESHVSSEADKDELRTSSTEITSKEEISDKEHVTQTITQESLLEKQKKETEIISRDKSDEEKEKKGERQDLLIEKKEESAEEVKETVEKEPSERLPQDPNLEKAAASESHKDESARAAARAEIAEPRETGEQQDVRVPIFTSFIDDTFDVSGESSDSSSDISRKTTLTARPYDTPRHRQKWQQQESLEIAGMPETSALTDERDTRMEVEPDEDTDSIVSLEESENVEEPSTVEEISESKEETAVAPQTISSQDEKIVSDSDKISGEDKEDESSRSKPEEHVKSDIMTSIQDLAVTTLSIKELNGVSKETVKGENILLAEEEHKSEIATSRANLEKVPETIKKDDKDAAKLPSGQIKQIDRKVSKVLPKDTVVDKIKPKDSEAAKIKSKGSKGDTLSTSERRVAKTESPESSAKKKKSEQTRTLLSDKTKHLDKEVKEKPTSHRSRRRSRKSLDGDLEKQPESDGSQKQPRREEEPRKQVLPRVKAKTDKKRTVSPRGEIDVSKTQSKYMAWYNKKREEAEKKRLEKKTAESEEQLPRWASRSLKQPTKRQGAEHKTPEMTPRTRRKIKPLVNAESEQLKAIVRQGRRLRKAEGSLKEDPPVEIFARTPPVSTTDAQHRLQQHSEYKYERVPPPFYLHPPPPPPHPSPQLSPERSLETQQPSTSRCEQPEGEICLEDVAPIQGGARLRHQQLLEKKSVFDIAYNEAAPSQLRSDSATPPS